jgi:hypothetical protein
MTELQKIVSDPLFFWQKDGKIHVCVVSPLRLEFDHFVYNRKEIFTMRKDAWILFLPLLLVLGGCGGGVPVQKTEMVEGVITLDGTPLDGAAITFNPVESDGTIASGFTDAQGRYTIQTLRGKPEGGTTVGEYIVTISKWEDVPTGRTERIDSETVIEIMDQRLLVHQNYENQQRSPLKATVVSGKNTFNFDLKRDGS